MGFSQNQGPPRRAHHLTSEEAEDSTPWSQEFEATLENPSQTKEGEIESNDTLRQVYQTMKKRQRAPPKGGYPFKKNDHVGTKMSREPPSPCKVCGSAKH
ncbi:hypothetical protein K438DRAFT_1993540 [Mycena galopus ATCC 62051]|nr:hypothetical protein K438DRAFT_1993540 [Mycena galopus ATCC 62051]